jgi:hypothetical protein
MKSGVMPPLFTKQTTKITLRTLLFTKNQSTHRSSKIKKSQSQIQLRLLMHHCFNKRNELTNISTI